MAVGLAPQMALESRLGVHPSGKEQEGIWCFRHVILKQFVCVDGNGLADSRSPRTPERHVLLKRLKQARRYASSDPDRLSLQHELIQRGDEEWVSERRHPVGEFLRDFKSEDPRAAAGRFDPAGVTKRRSGSCRGQDDDFGHFPCSSCCCTASLDVDSEDPFYTLAFAWPRTVG